MRVMDESLRMEVVHCGQQPGLDLWSRLLCTPEDLDLCGSRTRQDSQDPQLGLASRRVPLETGMNEGSLPITCRAVTADGPYHDRTTD